MRQRPRLRRDPEDDRRAADRVPGVRRSGRARPAPGRGPLQGLWLPHHRLRRSRPSKSLGRQLGESSRSSIELGAKSDSGCRSPTRGRSPRRLAKRDRPKVISPRSGIRFDRRRRCEHAARRTVSAVSSFLTARRRSLGDFDRCRRGRAAAGVGCRRGRRPRCRRRSPRRGQLRHRQEAHVADERLRRVQPMIGPLTKL